MGKILRWLLISGTLVFVLGCGAKPPNDGRTPEAQAGFARVKEARAELVAARQVLDRARAVTRGAVPDAGVLRQAQAAFEAAYTRDQKLLAAFLNVALNDSPDSPETRDALALYAQSAVENARFFLHQARDGHKAVQALEPAERCYLALGLPIPLDVATTLAEARGFQGSPPTPPPTAAPRAARRPRR
jgi:hypothetical protein